MRNVMFLGDSTMQIQTTALGVDWIGQICIFNLKYCRKKLKYKHCRLFIITTAYLLVESFLLSTVRLLSRTTCTEEIFHVPFIQVLYSTLPYAFHLLQLCLFFCKEIFHFNHVFSSC